MHVSRPRAKHLGNAPGLLGDAVCETSERTITWMRPPASFVPITPTRWNELARAIGERPRQRELRIGDVVIGWRNATVKFVDPRAYRRTLGTWPDGYWPE